MNEHYLNAERAWQQQQDTQAQAAIEQSLQVLHSSQQEPGVATDGRRLLAVLASGLRMGRDRLALR